MFEASAPWPCNKELSYLYLNYVYLYYLNYFCPSSNTHVDSDIIWTYAGTGCRTILSSTFFMAELQELRRTASKRIFIGPETVCSRQDMFGCDQDTPTIWIYTTIYEHKNFYMGDTLLNAAAGISVCYLTVFL